MPDISDNVVTLDFLLTEYLMLFTSSTQLSRMIMPCVMADTRSIYLTANLKKKKNSNPNL